MILSFHPIFVADQNRLCAGRDPDSGDLAAMRQASAVILPQGCRASLYEAARQNCARVFPNYDARFAYPGKIGQSSLFEQSGVPHPQTESYGKTAVFYQRHPDGVSPIKLPIVVKLNWGGEGEGVFPVCHDKELADVLKRLARFEASGQYGFVIQQWVPSGSRSLRVVVIGNQMVSYWRINPSDQLSPVSLAGGAIIDRASDGHLITAAESVTAEFCRQNGINLAGFDFLFTTDPQVTDLQTPLFLEINYFFGRRGLGGSEAYYTRLVQAIEHWLINGNQKLTHQ